jgi:SAM-dependent methyltransferase
MMAEMANVRQAQSWNGDSGRSWVALQSTLDRTLKPFEDLLVERVVFAAPATGSRILDVGCGTGATTIALAAQLGIDGACTGLDISEPMIAMARKRARAEHPPAEFLVGDAQTFRFRPATVDVVVSRFGVMFFDDPVAAFINLRRAAKVGGQLVFVCWRSPEDNPLMSVAVRAAAPLLPDVAPQIVGEPGPFAFADAEQVHSILAASGWTDINIRSIDVACSMPESDLLPYLVRMGPVGRTLPTVAAQTRSHVVDALREAYQGFIVDGEVRYNAACWMVNARADADRAEWQR